jgi:hypothetical protein
MCPSEVTTSHAKSKFCKALESGTGSPMETPLRTACHSMKHFVGGRSSINWLMW